MRKSNFQFTNPKLNKLIFNVNEDVVEYNNSDSLESAVEVQVNQVGAESAIVKLSLVMGDNKFCAFNLKLEMSANFVWTGIDSHEVEPFLKINAPSLLFSYIRPIVASITMQAGLEPVHLPFMNFSQR